MKKFIEYSGKTCKSLVYIRVADNFGKSLSFSTSQQTLLVMIK